MSQSNHQFPEKMPPDVMLHQMMTGFWISLAIHAAAKLGVADHIKDGSQRIDVLAKSVDAHPGALYRLLRALASVGVFSEVEAQRFALTPMGHYLRTDVPGSLRALILTLGELDWDSWGNLSHSIKTGETAFQAVHGMRFFEYLQGHPDKAKLFNEAMTGFVSKNIAAVLEAYDFTSFSKIIDVGGGHGAFMTAILEANPKAKGIIFDQPDVVDGTKKRVKETTFSNRCECIGGDFFASVPVDGDVYIMASIIHDWDDERSVAILKNCHRVMSNRAKLLLIEMIVPQGDTPSFGKLLDLHMLVNLGGRERTEAEYRDLLVASGFQLAKVIPTKGPSSVIEAIPQSAGG